MTTFIFRLRTYVLLLIFLGFLLYAKGLLNGFVGDDDLQIIRNVKIHSITNIPQIFLGSTYESAGSDSMTGIFYRPLMMSVFALIYGFSGPAPLMFHFVQLVFHIANCVLLFLFLRSFFKDISAFFLSLLFLIHPLNSESVLYIANLQEVLFFFFGIVALLMVQRKQLTLLDKLVIPFSLLFSLFAKETGVIFLVLVPLYAWFFSKDKKLFQFLLFTVPCTFLIYLIFRYGIAHMSHANASLAPIASSALPIRLLTIPEIIVYYLRMVIFPMQMSVYQFWVVTKPTLTEFWLPLGVLVVFLGILRVLYLRIPKKLIKYKLVFLFFLIWFILGLSLHVQFIPLDATVADRWFYAPFAGLLGLLGIIVRIMHFSSLRGILQSRMQKQSRIVTLPNLGIVLCLIVCSILATRTCIRISDWQNNVTLYGHDIHSPANFILENAYASALIQDEQFKSAQYHALLSIKQHPYTANMNNAAITYTALGDRAKAKQYFQQALKLGHNFAVYENYANFLLYYDDPAQALTFSQQALKLFPKSPLLYLTLGKAAYITGDKQRALKSTAQSYKLEPSEQTAEILATMQANKPLVGIHP